MSKSAALRITIIGAGPIGLEAALYAKLLGFTVKVYERGDVGNYVSRWGHVRLFSPFAMNHTSLGLEAIRKEHPQHDLPGPHDLITGNEFREAYLVPLTLTAGLCDCISTKTEVLHIGRAGVFKTDPPAEPKRAHSPFRLLTRNDKQQEQISETDVILDCSGTYTHHRWLGEGGIPALGETAAEKHVAYGLEDILGQRKSYYAGKSVIVIGGGYSAATTVCALAQLAEENSATWVIWLTRGPRTTPLPRTSADPLRERDRLAARANSLATRGEGHVEHHAQSVIEAIECHGPERGFRVSGRCAGKEMCWEVERVFANVGHRPDLSYCRELHVFEPNGKLGFRQPEPNYFLLGSKSFGRESTFLLRHGFEQIKEVFAHLTGQRKLDLYQETMSATARQAG